jgi:hypothetical protein
MNCVIDVNVLAAANLRADHISMEDALKCVEFLEAVKQEDGCVSMDEGGLIFEEYSKYASHKGQPGTGDIFFKWLWDNQGVESKCEKVIITTHEERGFTVFPDSPSLHQFDMDDRKHLAVAVASKNAPDIVNATDSDWWYFQDVFEGLGIKIKQLGTPPDGWER